MTKDKKYFRTFLVIYTIVLAVATIVICAIVWGKLSRYQKKYDNAMADAAPEAYIKDLVINLDYNKILECINEYGINVDVGVNPKENHAQYFYKNLCDNGVSYIKNEKYSSSMPIYDIYAGDERIVVISLKAAGNNNEYGFHKWTVRDMAFDTDKIQYHDIDVRVPKGSTVAYNLQILGDDYIMGDTIKDAAAAQLSALGVTPAENTIYHIPDTFGDYNILVMDSSGKYLEAEIYDGIYDYTGVTMHTDNEVINRVQTVMESYIYTIYNKKNFSQMTEYIDYSSPAYNMIADVVSSLAWAWKPDTVEILAQNVSDYIQYSDNIFACNYYGKIYKYKEGAEESGEEEFRYRLVFVKKDNQWYLNYFVII